MKNKRFTIVVLAITAAWSTTSFAEDSAAVAQCVALANQGKVTEAKPFCERAAEEPGIAGKALYAEFLDFTGDVDGAEKLYSKILEGVDLTRPTKEELSALRSRAVIGLRRGRTSAEDDARAVLKLAPDDAELLRAVAQSSPSAERRLEYADRLVALNPKSFEAHVMRANALTSNGKFQEALVAADTASKLDSKSPFPHVARGFAYSAMTEYAKAEREHAAAARKAPEEPEAKVNQAEMLVALKRFDDAIEAATLALNLKPDHARALRLRAAARLQMGDAEGALADVDASNKIQLVFDDLKTTAEHVLEIQNALQPASIATLEQDRETIIAGFRSHLNNTCGYYTIPDNEDNDGLNAYWNCIKAWYKAEGDMQNSVSRDAVDASMRFEEMTQSIEASAVLLCSRMPKKSRCISDSLYARAVAASDLPDPKGLVGSQEFNRLNQGVQEYNARLKRNNALINTANFLNALAGALSEQ